MNSVASTAVARSMGAFWAAKSATAILSPVSIGERCGSNVPFEVSYPADETLYRTKPTIAVMPRTMMIVTAVYAMISRRVTRLALSCASKKFT